MVQEPGCYLVFFGGPFLFSPSDPETFMCIHSRYAPPWVAEDATNNRDEERPLNTNCGRTPDGTVFCAPKGSVTDKDMKELWDFGGVKQNPPAEPE